MWDADGKRYIDYVGSWGPAILGHAHPAVVRAVQDTAAHGLSFGAPTEIEIVIAETLVRRLPSLDMVRLVSSGTEATMSALSLARGYTGRSKIMKFEGCYHGHGDSLLVKAGSGGLTFGQPSSAGVPPGIAGETIVAPYNDLAAVEAVFDADREEIAAMIVEPIAGNMNLVMPRRISRRTARAVRPPRRRADFRRSDDRISRAPARRAGHDRGHAGPHDAGQGDRRWHAGRRVRRTRAIMENIAPLGPVYQAGTLSGNPVAVAAGSPRSPKPKRRASTMRCPPRRAVSPRDGGGGAAGRRAVFCASGRRHVRHLFRAAVPDSYDAVMACDKERFNRFFHAMLDAGVYLAPSAFEAGFVSAAHRDDDIARRSVPRRRPSRDRVMPELPDVELYREALDARVSASRFARSREESLRVAHRGAAAGCGRRPQRARRRAWASASCSGSTASYFSWCI